jgi:hypothetical protein
MSTEISTNTLEIANLKKNSAQIATNKDDIAYLK